MMMTIRIDIDDPSFPSDEADRTTTTEDDTVGFRILRGAPESKQVHLEAHEDTAVLTPELLPARGDNVSGASYEWLDSAAPVTDEGLVYYLEEIDGGGQSTRYGPVSVGGVSAGAQQRLAP